MSFFLAQECEKSSSVVVTTQATMGEHGYEINGCWISHRQSLEAAW